MNKKYCPIILFLMCFSVQAEDKKLMLDEHFTTHILSGEKDKIQYVVETWIASLLKEKGDIPYPSNLKTEQDRRLFFQLLKTADEEKDISALISLADAYLFSAEKEFKYLLQNNLLAQLFSYSFLNNMDMFMESLVERQSMDIIIKEWTISLVFLSFSGFFSQYGKNKYIDSISKFHVLYNFSNDFYNTLKPKSFQISKNEFFDSYLGQPFNANKRIDNIKKFNKSFEKMKDTYFDFILPSFMKLSWVQHDLQYSNQPEVSFEYGKILHQAYGNKDKGLSYISDSAEQGYPPALKHLGKYYLSQKGPIQTEGEGLMTQYLKTSNSLIEKISVAYQLFSVNIMRGQNRYDSLQKGVSSLTKSCKEIFTNDK